MTQYFLGIDGGGTSCRVRLVNDTGTILGEAQSGSANLYLGQQVVLPHIQEAITTVMAQAGLGADVYAQTYVVGGLAGAESTDSRDWLFAYFNDFAGFRCVSDCETACIGAFGGADGAVLIAGTGSIGWAISGDKNYRIGGWGFHVSDAYSGAWIGHQLIRWVLKSHDGLCHSPLCDVVLQNFDNNPDAIVQWASTAKPADYGAYAPWVIEYAHKGDSIALDLLHQAGQGVGDMVKCLLQKSGCKNWCFAGGLASVLNPYVPVDIRAKLQPSLGDALQGAIILAHRLAEKQLAEKQIRRREYM